LMTGMNMQSLHRDIHHQLPLIPSNQSCSEQMAFDIFLGR
jgi:hypothetical protein